jgi:hypothetical protein
MTTRVKILKISMIVCESYVDGSLPERRERHVINNKPVRHQGAAPPSRSFSSNPDFMIEWLDSS